MTLKIRPIDFWNFLIGGKTRGLLPDLKPILWYIWLSGWDSALVACGTHSVERCLSIRSVEDELSGELYLSSCEKWPSVLGSDC